MSLNIGLKKCCLGETELDRENEKKRERQSVRDKGGGGLKT